MILKRSGLVNALIVFVLFILLVKFDVVFADYSYRENCSNAGRWRMFFGM